MTFDDTFHGNDNEEPTKLHDPKEPCGEGCEHTIEQHEAVNKVQVYLDTIRGNHEEDVEMYALLRKQLGFDFCGELLLAAKHMQDYHPVINPDSIEAIDEDNMAMKFMCNRGHQHADSVLEQIHQNKDEAGMDMHDLLVAFATAVFFDGIINGMFMGQGGECIIKHEHNKTAKEAEEFLKSIGG